MPASISSSPFRCTAARRRARGFNQAEELARHLGLRMDDALRRTRATPSQTDLPAARRHANVREPSRVQRGHLVDGLTVRAGGRRVHDRRDAERVRRRAARGRGAATSAPSPQRESCRDRRDHVRPDGRRESVRRPGAASSSRPQLDGGSSRARGTAAPDRARTCRVRQPSAAPRSRERYRAGW